MPSGEMRRPPQIWEQRLARTTAVLGVGLSNGGDATAVVPPTPPPGSGGGVEPAPVLPAPDTFTTPSTPTLSGTVQGLRVSWNGLNANGDTYPTGAYVEIHISTTGATFTPDATTLAGTLLGSAGFFTISALTAGTTYYVRLVGVDEAGNRTSPSTAASGQTGLTTSSDYGTATITAGAVSFDARQIGGITSTVGTATPSSPVAGDIWLDTAGGATTHKRWNGTSWETILFGSGSIAGSAITSTKIADDAITTPKLAANVVTAAKIAANTITASQIAASTITSTNLAAGAVTAGAIAAGAVTTAKLDAGAVTADKIAASTITGDKIAANTIDATKISAAFITAADVNGNVTSISGSTITSGTISGRTVQSSSGSARIVLNSADTLDFYSSNVKRGDIYGVTVSGLNGLGITGALDVSSTIFGQGVSISTSTADFIGVYNNNTTGLDEVGITTAGRLRRLSSSQSIKYDIATLGAPLSPSVEAAKVCDVVTVNPTALLDVAVAEFSVIDDGEATDRRILGFIAEDVADKLPIAVSRDADGNPAGVLDTSLLAALVAVVQDMEKEITDLRARIEALEA